MTPATLTHMGMKSPLIDYWQNANTALEANGFPPLSPGQADAYWQDGASTQYILKRARDCYQEERRREYGRVGL